MDGTVREARREDGRPARCATAPGMTAATAGTATGGAGGGIGFAGALVVKAAGAFNGGLDAVTGTGREDLAAAGLALTGDLLLAGAAFTAIFVVFATGRPDGAAGLAADLVAGFATGLPAFLAGAWASGFAGLLAGCAAALAGLAVDLLVLDFGLAAAVTGFLAFAELLFTIDSWQDIPAHA